MPAPSPSSALRLDRVTKVFGTHTAVDALSLDVIRRVGPRAHFLYEPHTRDGLRRLEFSGLTGQTAPDGSRRDAVEVARDEVERILATHRPEPLDDARLRELERIVAAADREMDEPHDGRPRST